VETFVVRAWRSSTDDISPDDEPADDTLRGVVEHVGSGASMPFRDVDQLISFLRSRPADGGSDRE
jgi:hypothetical protein